MRLLKMHLGHIIAKNISDVMSISGGQLKIVHAKALEAGIDINYTTLTKLANFKSDKPQNPTVETLELIAGVLQQAAGFEHVEPWMLLHPDFFKDGQHLLKSGMNERFMAEFMGEFTYALTTMKVLQLSKEQYENLQNVAKFVYMKKLGLHMQPESEGNYKSN